LFPQGRQEVALTDPRSQEQARDWVDEFRPAVRLALAEFLSSARWPVREQFRRKLVQRKLDYLNFDQLIHDMPISPWETRRGAPERIVLSLQVLLEMVEAQRLLGVCVKIVNLAYELYLSDQDAEPLLISEDPALVAAADGDEHLLFRALAVLDQHPPSPLEESAFGLATPAADPSHWSRRLNHETVHAFKGVTSIGDYLAAQQRVISSGATPPAVATETTANAVSRTDVFVIMPFSEPWSDSTYAFIRRAIGRLDASDGALHLYRADDIAEPGQITQQVRDSIAAAHVTIADITDVNPNVMWELGYADGLGRTIVILNQRPGSSPFDMRDRRQVAYSAVPTAEDEEALLRHIVEALRIGSGKLFTDPGTEAERQQ